MRIVGLCPEHNPNARYRLIAPLETLGARGHDVAWHLWDGTGPIPAGDALRSADVVHLWRLYQPAVHRLLGTVKKSGVGVSWDNDDDMLEVPKTSPAYRQIRSSRPQIKAALAGMLRGAHVVTTTSPELARRFRALGAADVQVIENQLEDLFIVPGRRVRDRVVVGWHGGDEHRTDERELRIGETLGRLLERHANLHVVTVRVDLRIDHPRYRRVHFIPYAQLPAQIAQFDIGIAPLAPTAFNRSRSNIKVKEYAGAGTAWLASPIGPYAELGEEQGGRLVPDDRWEEELERLILDAGARAALGRRGEAWARSQALMQQVGAWEEAFATAARKAGRRPSIPQHVPAPPRQVSGPAVLPPGVRLRMGP